MPLALAPARAHRAGPPWGGTTAFTAMLRGASIPTATYGAAVGLAAGVGAGWLGAASAVAGVAGVAGFFATGMLALRVILAGPAGAALAGALAVYVGQTTLALGAILVLQDRAWLEATWFTVGALGATVIWQAGQIRGLVRARQLVYAEVTMPSGAP